jgi:hypothetical protein
MSRVATIRWHSSVMRPSGYANQPAVCSNTPSSSGMSAAAAGRQRDGRARSAFGTGKNTSRPVRYARRGATAASRGRLRARTLARDRMYMTRRATTRRGSACARQHGDAAATLTRRRAGVIHVHRVVRRPRSAPLLDGQVVQLVERRQRTVTCKHARSPHARHARRARKAAMKPLGQRLEKHAFRNTSRSAATHQCLRTHTRMHTRVKPQINVAARTADARRASQHA